MNIRDCLLRGMQATSEIIINEMEKAISEKTLNISYSIAEHTHNEGSIIIPFRIRLDEKFMAHINIKAIQTLANIDFDDCGRIDTYDIEVSELASVEYRLNNAAFTENGVGIQNGTKGAEDLRSYLVRRFDGMSYDIRYDEEREPMSINFSLKK